MLTAPADGAYSIGGNAVVADGATVRVYGKSGGWLMIGFASDHGMSVGYVQAAAVSVEGAPTLHFMSETVALSEEAKLTDDPDSASYTMATLAKGSDVKVLGILDSWAYVQTAVQGKTARGFIDKGAVGR